jgi:hypothetical protein
MSRARSGVPLGTRRPSLGPPAGAVRLNVKAGLITLWLGPGNRTVLSVQKPWFDGCFYTEAGGQDPRGGPLAPPRGVQRLALPRAWSWQAVKAAPASAGQLLPPLTAGIGAPVGAAMAGRAAWLAEPGGCTSRTLPELGCLALAPLVAATGVALGAFRRRGFIDDDSDAIRLRNPTRCRRLAGSRQCVGDHLLPVTGGTYESRCRRLGSPQSSPEVPAETQEGPAGTGRGWDTAEGSVFGVRPLEVPVRSAVAHRRDPSTSLTRSAPSRQERAWPFAVDWRVLLARSPAAGIAGPGNDQAGQPEPKDPKDGVDAAGRPRYLPTGDRPPRSRRVPRPGCGGAARLRATVSTDAGTQVRMMRTRWFRPRTIRSASPVGSWPTASCRRGPWPAW